MQIRFFNVVGEKEGKRGNEQTGYDGKWLPMPMDYKNTRYTSVQSYKSLFNEIQEKGIWAYVITNSGKSK